MRNCEVSTLFRMLCLLGIATLAPATAFADKNKSSFAITATVVNSCTLVAEDPLNGISEFPAEPVGGQKNLLSVNCDHETAWDQSSNRTQIGLGRAGAQPLFDPSALNDGAMISMTAAEEEERPYPRFPYGTESWLTRVTTAPPIETSMAPLQERYLRITVDF